MSDFQTGMNERLWEEVEQLKAINEALLVAVELARTHFIAEWSSVDWHPASDWGEHVDDMDAAIAKARGDQTAQEGE